MPLHMTPALSALISSESARAEGQFALCVYTSKVTLAEKEQRPMRTITSSVATLSV